MLGGAYAHGDSSSARAHIYSHASSHHANTHAAHQPPRRAHADPYFHLNAHVRSARASGCDGG